MKDADMIVEDDDFSKEDEKNKQLYLKKLAEVEKYNRERTDEILRSDSYDYTVVKNPDDCIVADGSDEDDLGR